MVDFKQLFTQRPLRDRPIFTEAQSFSIKHSWGIFVTIVFLIVAFAAYLS